MSSFGAQLRQERERQGISLEDISLTTKIGTRMLRALEEEHFDQLPGGIFNKGFIRAYARCLNMDEEQAIADYLAATGASPLAKNNDQAPILDPPSREENPAAAGLPWGTFAIVLLIVALGFTAWGFYSRESENAGHDSAPTTANSAAVSPPSVSPPAPSEQSPAEQKPAESVDSSTAVSKPAEPATATKAAEATPSQAVTTPPLPSTASQPQPAVPTNGTLLVVIRAREDSWLSISVDGEIVTRALLTAPAQKTVRAQNQVIIHAGNVGALDFEFNGKKLPTQGDYGEVKTLIFDAHGLQPPAPKPEAPAQLQ